MNQISQAKKSSPACWQVNQISQAKIPLTVMSPSPIYLAQNLQPVYSLRYTSTGWPTSGLTLPPEPPAAQYYDLNALWEGNGIRLLETAFGDYDMDTIRRRIRKNRGF